MGEVMEVVDRDRLFMDESGGGVTFSGGEPLLQAEFLAEMLRECKRRELNTAVDTSGYGAAELVKAILPDVDLFLFDLKIMDESEHQKYVAVSNRRILANLKILAESAAKTVIRFPVIPRITDGSANLEAMAEHLASLKTIREIHLLAYHRYAAAKYERLGMENRMAGVEAPTGERMREIEELFRRHGFVVHLGG